MAEQYLYDLDVTGQLAANRIPDEQHTIQVPVGEMSVFIVPDAAPFFKDNFVITLGTGPGAQTLTEGTHFKFTHRFVEASAKLGKQIYGSISFIDRNLAGTVYISYNTLGGAFTLDSTNIVVSLTQSLYNLRTVTWDQVLGVPVQLPPIAHQQELGDLAGFDDFTAKLDEVKTALQNLTIPAPVLPPGPYGTWANPWVLLSSDNLDNKIDPGIYQCPTGVVADVVRNFPKSGITGYMKVIKDNKSPSLLVQEFHLTSDPAIAENNGFGTYPTLWRRFSTNNGDNWTAWEKTDINSIAALIAPIPTGAIMDHYGRTAPSGWLAITGGTIGGAASNATTRANEDTRALFTMIWEDFTNVEKPILNSDGSPGTRGANADADFDANKQLPLNDDRGLFRRTWNDDATGHDANRELHSYQADENKSHNHTIDGNNGDASGQPLAARVNSDGKEGVITTTEDSGGAEARPKNRAYLTIVKL